MMNTIVKTEGGKGSDYIIMTYTFTGAEASGTEIIRSPKIFGRNLYLSIRKISETGIATTTANIGIASNDEDQSDDSDFFVADAALAAGDAVLFSQAATEEKEVDFMHQITVTTSNGAVAGNAGLTIKFEIQLISKAP